MVRILLAGLFAASLAACSTPPRGLDDLVGQSLPTVRGKSLAGEQVVLPSQLPAGPTLILAAYHQSAQFDVDRWLIGIDQLGVSLPIFEVPAVRGWAPRLFRRNIDGGMRDGIPTDDWSSVITVYKDADKLAAFTGIRRPRVAHVLLLDGQRVVRFAHREGFSVQAVNGLAASLRALRDETQATDDPSLPAQSDDASPPSGG